MRVPQDRVNLFGFYRRIARLKNGSKENRGSTRLAYTENSKGSTGISGIRQFLQEVCGRLLQDHHTLNGIDEERQNLHMDSGSPASIRRPETTLHYRTTLGDVRSRTRDSVGNRCFGLRHRSMFKPETRRKTQTSSILFPKNVTRGTEL